MQRLWLHIMTYTQLQQESLPHVASHYKSNQGEILKHR